MAQRSSASARRILIYAVALAVAGAVVAPLLKAKRLLVQAPAPQATLSVPSPPQEPVPSPSASVAPAPSRPPLLDESPDTIDAQREVLFKNMQTQLELSDEVIAKTRAIFAEA